MTPPESQLIDILEITEGEADSLSLRSSGQSLPDVLPILGLSDIVFFPGMVSPLLVNTAESIRLIDEVVGGNRFVGMILQTNSEAENPTPEDLHAHGCVGRVLRMLKFPDNTVRVLVEGLRRFRVIKYRRRKPYLKAQVEFLEEEEERSVRMTALSRNVTQLFEQVIELNPTLNDQVKVAALNTTRPSRLADIIAANLNLKLSERQMLLEMLNVYSRLEHLNPMLNRELEVLTLGSKIQKEVADSLSKNQKDYYLREQIRALQRELGEEDPEALEITRFRNQIHEAQMPPSAREACLQELERLQRTPPAAAEYSILRNYIDWALALPWGKCSSDHLDLKKAESLLNARHYGLDQVKDRLLEYLAVLKLRGAGKVPILCLVGPPGVGKTSLGQSIADALGRKFTRIALGGLRDEAEIRGHRRTYVGAMPGRVIQGIRKVGVCNPVILLDEIDKVGTDFRGDPASALLEVLDPEQNAHFSDHFLEIPFDLSQVLFLTTANWLEPIPAPLRDRLELIELPSYTPLEKARIARRYLIPKQLKDHGLKVSDIRFEGSAIDTLIRDHTHEAGVRQLDRQIASTVRKLVRHRLNDVAPKETLVLNATSVAELLGPGRFSRDKEKPVRDSGVVMGLAWTPMGGEVLFIEATSMPGKGKLILTGSLGEIMKESAMTAHSYLRHEAPKWPVLSKIDFDQIDLHIHIPAGATPKDGPSAGAAIATALLSLLTGKPVRPGTAMSGEISLRGRLLPVGGVKEKVLAAARFPLKTVILPAANRKDWNQIPKEVRKRVQVQFAEQLSEVFAMALDSKP